MRNEILRAHAEVAYAHELEELQRADSRARPANWRLSPWAVATYILGGTLDNGFEVLPKYIGNGRLIEIAIATLTTDRALLLMGIPGTGKTWVAEHLAAAISGDSTLLVQGHGRRQRRGDPLWLELRQPHRPRPDSGSAGAQPGDDRDGRRQAGARGRIDAHSR